MFRLEFRCFVLKLCCFLDNSKAAMSILKECCLRLKVGHFCFRVNLLCLKVRPFLFKFWVQIRKKVTPVRGRGNWGGALAGYKGSEIYKFWNWFIIGFSFLHKLGFGKGVTIVTLTFWYDGKVAVCTIFPGRCFPDIFNNGLNFLLKDIFRMVFYLVYVVLLVP